MRLAIFSSAHEPQRKTFSSKNLKTILHNTKNCAMSLKIQRQLLLDDAAFTANTSSVDTLNALSDTFNAYTTAFDQIAENIVKIGLNKKAGLQGEMRNHTIIIQGVMVGINEPAVVLLLKEMQAKTAQFLLEHNKRAVKRVSYFAKKLAKGVTEANPAELKDLLSGIDQYVASFNNLATTTLEVDTQIEELEVVYAAAQPHMDALRQAITEQIQKVNEIAKVSEHNASLISIVTIVASLGLMLLLTLYINNMINYPIRRLKKTMGGPDRRQS